MPYHQTAIRRTAVALIQCVIGVNVLILMYISVRALMLVAAAEGNQALIQRPSLVFGLIPALGVVVLFVVVHRLRGVLRKP
jgi:hypothetical protein